MAKYRRTESQAAENPTPGELRPQVLLCSPLNPKVLNNLDPGLVIWVLTITLRKRQRRPNGLWLPGPLAQSVEQRTFNPWVVGSIPTGPTREVYEGNLSKSILSDLVAQDFS